jgi:hypothetical protein
MRVKETGATGLEPATSGVTGRHSPGERGRVEGWMTAANCAGGLGFAPATQTASVLQATAFRGDATRFRLNALVRPPRRLGIRVLAERCGTRVLSRGGS